MQCSNVDLGPVVSLPDIVDSHQQEDVCSNKTLTVASSPSVNELQPSIEMHQFQAPLDPLNHLQSSMESVNQLQPSVLNDISLMYLIQQQQQQQQQQQHVSIANTENLPSSSAMMMMSPTTLQSLLMSQVMASIQHTSTSPASQYLVGVAPAASTVPFQMTNSSELMINKFTTQSNQLNGFSTNCITTPSVPGLQTNVQTSVISKPDCVPPKKPLTPYMKFSKSIWQHVKNANPSMSVCEVGASIGRMWREMPEADKQRYNDDFSREKVQYEAELQKYLKTTGVQMTDIAKIRSGLSKKNNAKDKSSRVQFNGSTPPHVGVVTTNSDTVVANNVLPHIGQIWSSTHLHSVTEHGDLQLNDSLLTRSTPSDSTSHTDICDDNIDMLPDSLLSSSQLAWLEQSDDTKRLLANDPLCIEFSNGLSDGLEPGEVVFDDAGIVPAAAILAKTSSSSAHNLFNSYAFNPWKRFQGALGVSGSAAFERDQLLQSERRHLRLALEDKMREVRELTCDIQKVYETIDELRRLHGGLLVDANHGEDLTRSIAETGSDVNAILEQGLILDCGSTEVSNQCLDSCLEPADVDGRSSANEASMLQALHDVVKCESESNDTSWTNNQLITTNQFQSASE